MHQLAQGLASLGRGQDKMLVHMTPKEVAGLQSLAVAHGGSLTINPHTGLPEAGFLSSILPMVAAGAAIAATGGAATPLVGGMSPAMWGMGAGALTGMMTNRQNPIMGGLMGGLSGYGMAGMMNSLAGAGTQLGAVGDYTGSLLAEPVDFASALGRTPPVATLPVASNVSEAAANVTGIRPETMAQFGAPNPSGITIGGIPQYGGPNAWGDVTINPGLNIAPRLPPTPITPGSTEFVGGFGGDVAPVVAPATVPAVPTTPVVAPVDYSAQYLNSGISDVTPMPQQSYSDRLMRGVGIAVDNPLKFIKENKVPVAAVGIPLGMAGLQAMARQPTLPASMAATAAPAQYYKTSYGIGTRNPNFGEPGQPYFIGQGYNPAGFSSTFAMGGSVPGENRYYPGANIARGGVASMLQSPTATEVVGGYDTGLNPYTGEPVRMAKGGITTRGIYSDEPGPGPYSDKDIPSSGRYDVAPNVSSDPFQGINSLVNRMPPSMLARLAKGAKSPAMQAAATRELMEREYTPNSYIETAAQGGLMGGEYAAGGTLLQGPGDGMSDSIPAVIKGDKPQRAALAQGEFVVPADVVSHLGNGSTEAGSKHLYAMMDRVRKARTGTKQQGRKIDAGKLMPA